MKRGLVLKYLFIFGVIIFSLFVLVNTYGENYVTQSILKEKKDLLNNQTELISKQYASTYFSSDLSAEELRKQLNAVDKLTDTRIWITNASGSLIVDTRSNSTNIDIRVQDIDPNILDYTSKEHIQYSTYFKEPMLLSVNTIVVDYEIKGYVLIFLPESTISDECMIVTNVLNILLLIFTGILGGILFSIYLFTVRPVRKLIKAAREYSLGHFDYPIALRTHDEYEDLSTTLSFMASELSSLDDYQKKFIANISHDFRSPLTSIKGYAEAMLDGTIPYEMQNKYLEIILFETQRLNKLTNNLLTLNSFERNGALLNITSFDINQVIKRTVTTFEGICTKKKITINLFFANKEQYVDADMDKIQQVLYNLIDNAIKFSHSNSQIKISSTEKGGKAFIAVKDYGIGIPKESVGRIWERFYKTDASRGKDKKGTGLGLSITREIIISHNENINVISTDGVGSEFIFSLPLTEE